MPSVPTVGTPAARRYRTAAPRCGQWFSSVSVVFPALSNRFMTGEWLCCQGSSYKRVDFCRKYVYLEHFTIEKPEYSMTKTSRVHPALLQTKTHL
jgi:hypothetical protein